MNGSTAWLATVTSVCFLLSVAAAGRAASPAYAPIMPLAPKSLLLDITAAGARLVVVGERGHVLYSDDGGDSWTQAKVPTTQMLTSVYFIDAERGWAAGHDGLILVSDDGGQSWRVQRDGLAVQHQANLESREKFHQRVQELERHLATTVEETRTQLELDLEDAQLELEDADLYLEEPVFTSALMDVWFQNADSGWAVGAFGTLVATENGGQQWLGRDKQLDNPDELHLNAITGDGKGRVFIAGEGGVMFRSADGGRSWESLQPFYEGSWFGALYNPHNDSLLIFGLRGNLYRSSDFGTTWEPVPTDSDRTLAGGSVSRRGEIVIAGGVGTVLFSFDGGQSFQRTMMEDRLSLGSGLALDGKLALVGQGGIKFSGGPIRDD